MKNEELVKQTIEACKQAELSFCKFLSANDTGETGGHQTGIFIPKSSVEILFDRPGTKGSNKDKFVDIRWLFDDSFVTQSRFIYYGQKTRNEYRITRFGKGFELLSEEMTGSLFVLIKNSETEYDAVVIEADEDIDYFLAAFGMTPADTNKLINVSNKQTIKPDEISFIEKYLLGLHGKFPSGDDIATNARSISNLINRIGIGEIKKHPDDILLKWIEMEYTLFKAVENTIYADLVSKPFGDVDKLVNIANTILNRRKSRAGKSLEYHLKEVFDVNNIKYSYQAVTEQNKRPDFIFPDIKFYFDNKYKGKLTFLACKTTCKDRWRQILNEADRIPVKHLFTLQQGISQNQIKEMQKHKVQLIVPKKYKNFYHKSSRKHLITLMEFVAHV